MKTATMIATQRMRADVTLADAADQRSLMRRHFHAADIRDHIVARERRTVGAQRCDDGADRHREHEQVCG
jgi:hypothetical protein